MTIKLIYLKKLIFHKKMNLYFKFVSALFFISTKSIINLSLLGIVIFGSLISRVNE
jgi:hypothetical protein